MQRLAAFFASQITYYTHNKISTKMKRTTPWIVALACLTTIGGSLWAASEMNLAPWAAPAPAPAPAPKQLTVTAAPTDSVADTGGTVTLTINSDTAWSASTASAWITLSPTSGPKGAGSVTVIVAANTTSSSRTATIEVYATDSSALKQIITINQKAQAPATIAVTGVSLDKSNETLTASGATLSLTATVAPTNASNQSVTWETSAPGVASVSGSGLTATVTPLTAGSATISVKTVDGNFTASCNVTVNAAAVPVTGVSFSPDKDTVVLGSGNRTITATITPNTATNKTVTWESLTPTVATVTPGSGLTATVNPLTVGDAVIQVKTADGNFTSNYRLHIKPAAGTPRTFTVTPTTFSNPASGGSGRDTINIASNVAWVATVQAGQNWLSAEGATTGTGNGRVILTYTTNTSAARSATVTLKTAANDTTVTVTVNQAAGSAVLELEDTAQLRNVPFTGSNISIKVKSNVRWRITSDAGPWIQFLDTQGNPQTARQGGNDQTVTVRVLPNLATIGRTAKITVETEQTGVPKITRTANVSQSATDFSFNINGLPEPVDAAGGEFALALSGSANYAVSTRNTDWLKIKEAEVEKDSISYAGGTRTFKFLVKGNETGGPRIGYVRVYYGGALVQTRKVTQTGNQINVQIITPGTIPVNGGTKEVRISGSAKWNIRISADWLRVDKKKAATGAVNDTLITFRAAGKNPSIQPRTATVTVLTKLGKEAASFTLTQDGTFSTVYDKNLFESTSEKGGERTVTVNSEQPWLPTLSEVAAAPAATAELLRVGVSGTDTTLTWLTVNYDREAGPSRYNGTVKIVVKPNKTQLSREALLILKTTNGVALDTVVIKQYNVSGKMTPRAAAVKVTSLTMNRPNVTINGEKNVQLSVAVKPDNATNKNVTWARSDTSIAKVDAKGLVTIGRKKGKVTITATAADGSGVKATSIIDVLIPQANMELSGLKVYATAGQLHLSLPASDDVQIYAVSGALVRSFTAPAGDTSVSLPSGIYIVRVGSLTEKVAVE